MNDNLKWCINKLNEVALDLREPQRGAQLEHQAQKLDEVIRRLIGDDPEIAPRVHGSGTGKNVGED